MARCDNNANAGGTAWNVGPMEKSKIWLFESITDYSSNFVNWTPLATNLVGTSELAIFATRPSCTGNRFYRAHTRP